jgi:hypothetical protein
LSNSRQALTDCTVLAPITVPVGEGDGAQPGHRRLPERPGEDARRGEMAALSGYDQAGRGKRGGAEIRMCVRPA